MKPQRKTFDVATNDPLYNHRAQRTGYVLGDWATHKERYHWVFTHLSTGVAVSAPWIEKKAPALEHLQALHASGGGIIPEYSRKLLVGGQWGLGMCGR